MKGAVSGKVVLREVWSLVKDSLTWKCERKGFRKSGLKRGLVLVRDSFPQKYERKGFRKSGLKRAVVLGFLVRDSFTKSMKGKVSGNVVLKEVWSLIRYSFPWKYERKGVFLDV